MYKELKNTDHSFSAQAIVATVTGAEVDPQVPVNLKSISLIDQGTASYERIGRKVLLTRARINGRVYMANISGAGTMGTSSHVRIYMVLDNQTNGAQMNSEDFLDDTSTAKDLSFLLEDGLSRYEVLDVVDIDIQKVCAFTDGANTGTYTGQSKYFSMDVPLYVETYYIGTGLNIATVADNSVHMIAVASDNGLMLEYESRVNFFG